MQVRSWDCTLPEWSKAWQEIPADAIVMAARNDRVVFARIQHAQDQEWDRGHCFTPEWHVYWRRLGSRVRIVLIAEQAILPTERLGPPSHAVDLGNTEETAHEFVLWGLKRPDEDMWIELVVPQIMQSPHGHPEGVEAPSSDHSRRFLHAVSYRDRPSFGVVATRYTHISCKPEQYPEALQ